MLRSETRLGRFIRAMTAAPAPGPAMLPGTRPGIVVRLINALEGRHLCGTIMPHRSCRGLPGSLIRLVSCGNSVCPDIQNRRGNAGAITGGLKGMVGPPTTDPTMACPAHNAAPTTGSPAGQGQGCARAVLIKLSSAR